MLKVNDWTDSVNFSLRLLSETLMDSTKTEAYFALSWLRLEQGLSRAITRALHRYLDKIQFTSSGGKGKREIGGFGHVYTQVGVQTVVHLRHFSQNF